MDELLNMQCTQAFWDNLTGLVVWVGGLSAALGGVTGAVLLQLYQRGHRKYVLPYDPSRYVLTADPPNH